MTDPTAGLTRVARQPSAVLRVPVSTYRIQLGRTFTFTDLHDLVPYLADLGITDCYLSPFLLPCSDDSHGYDIADHNRFNSALGTEADFRACVDALRAHGLGVLADVVPNHMGISGSRNRWWLDLLEKLNGLFVDGAGRRVLDGTYARFVGTRTRFRELAYETRRLIIDSSMSSEINVLGHRLARMSERQRSSRDFTDPSLVEALREVIASFPVYRTYVGEELDLVTDRDRRYIEQAVFAARRQNPTTNVSIFHFIRDLLCLRFPDWLSQAERLDRLHFVMKVQQLTGPVSAKGVEDTAFYQYNRLISLNEVGGDPELFGVAPDEFHQLNAGRGAGWPWALSAALAFLAIALIAGLLGFTGVAGTAAWIAQILFIVFLVLFVASLVFGRGFRRL